MSYGSGMEKRETRKKTHERTNRSGSQWLRIHENSGIISITVKGQNNIPNSLCIISTVEHITFLENDV